MFFGKSLLTLSAAAVLTACGGGGGGTSDVPAETSLSGVVAKGPAVGAKVKVYAVANGVKGGLLTEATTTTGGSYAVKFARQSGPVLIEAELNGATITNETGGTFLGKTGDVMKAAFVPGAGATQVANVTPFSHMAAVAAVNLSANEVLAANAVVRQILGNKDFLTVSPTATEGESLLPVLTELAARSVDGNESQISTLLGELAGAIKKNDDGEFDTSGDYAAALCGSTAPDKCLFANQDSVVPVSPSANLVAVESAKTLFKDLYDTFTSIETTGDLQKSSDGLTNAAAAAVAFIDDDQMQLVGSVINGVDLLDAYKNGGQSSDSNCFVGIVTGLDNNGKIVESTAISSTLADFTRTTANAVFCNGERYRFNGTIVRSGTNGSYVNPEIYNQLILLPETNGPLSYASRVRVEGAFSGATSGLESGTDRFTLGGLTAIQYGTATVTDTSATLVGKLAPSAQIALQKGVTAWNTYAYHDINLTGSATGTEVNGDFEASSVALSGAIKLIKKDSTEASSLNIVSGNVSTTAINVNVNAQAPGIKIEGIISGTGTNGEPTALTFTGSIYEADAAAGYRKLLEGKVEATALSANGGNIKFTGQLLLKERQPIIATLSGSNAADVWSNKQATFAWNGKSFTITEVLVNNAAVGVKVANSNGVTFEVPSAGIGPDGVPVKVGTDVVGTLLSDGRINFADGSYLAI
jgi:hypothetical protein